MIGFSDCGLFPRVLRASGGALIVVLMVLATPYGAMASLLSYWKFDEASGPTAFDSAGSIDGTLQGGAAFVPGQGVSGGAIQLNSATNGLVNMGDYFSFDGSSDFSIQAWFKTLPNSTESMFAVSRHHSTVVAGYFLGLNDSGDGLDHGALHFYLGTGGGYNAGKSDLPVNDGEWHQAVEVFEAGGQSKLYIDGALQDTRASTLFNTTITSFLVGGLSNPSNLPIGAFTGLIDEVRVYGNALSAADVSALFQPADSAVPEPSSMLLWAAGSACVFGNQLRRRKAAAHAVDSAQVRTART